MGTSCLFDLSRAALGPLQISSAMCRIHGAHSTTRWLGGTNSCQDCVCMCSCVLERCFGTRRFDICRPCEHEAANEHLSSTGPESRSHNEFFGYPELTRRFMGTVTNGSGTRPGERSRAALLASLWPPMLPPVALT